MLDLRIAVEDLGSRKLVLVEAVGGGEFVANSETANVTSKPANRNSRSALFITTD